MYFYGTVKRRAIHVFAESYFPERDFKQLERDAGRGLLYGAPLCRVNRFRIRQVRKNIPGPERDLICPVCLKMVREAIAIVQRKQEIPPDYPRPQARILDTAGRPYGVPRPVSLYLPRSVAAVQQLKPRRNE